MSTPAGNLEKVRAFAKKGASRTLMEAIGIEITKIDSDGITGTMPVDHRTHQPAGLLHGGASVALAETLCSIGAHLFLDLEKQTAVGLEINANHLRSIRSGTVTGVGKPIHVGKRTQIWQMEIRDTAGELICISRCTLAVVEKK